MLKELKGALVGVVATTVVFSTVPAFAKSAQEMISVAYNNIKIVVDGNQIQTEAEPFVYNGKTYLPVRDVATAVGKEVNWDGATKTVYLGAYTPSSSNTSASQPPATGSANQQPQQTVTVDPSDAYATAINNVRNSQEKTNAAINNTAKTEYTKYASFVQYLKGTDQIDESLAYRDSKDGELLGRASDGKVYTNYYHGYYYNEFLEPGMVYIPCSPMENPVRGYTVVATAYDRNSNLTYLELQKDNQILVNESAATLKTGSRSLYWMIDNGTFTIYQTYTDSSTGHQLEKRFDSKDLTIGKIIGDGQFTERVIAISDLENLMSQQPATIFDYTAAGVTLQ